jgi:SAM-dependent methyltransferase
MRFAGDYQTRERMEKKLRAVPLPLDLRGKNVLDVGCDHGAWCALAHERGAKYVLGLDRGRAVKGLFTDLVALNSKALPECAFESIELGRQWHLFGDFDLVLMLNLYHHVYAVAQDHEPIWYWLHQSTAPNGELLWENPTSVADGVALKNIPAALHGGYNEQAIRAAGERYFDIEVVGGGWVASRVVWRCTPKNVNSHSYAAVKDGAGGASKAFAFANERRMREIEAVLGFSPVPGSLNLQAAAPFDYDRKYLRTQILDVVDRKHGLASAWAPRWCRFYPLDIEGERAYAMRFEGERYPDTLVELIAGIRLRTKLNLKNGEEVCLSH